jgi:phospholipid/cholesterol/gamma-HCH transport system ATP-binding protein
VIELRAVSIGDFRGASFSLHAGERCRLLLSSDADVTLLLRLIVGTARPESGAVVVFGADAAHQSESWAVAAMTRLGIVWPGGGYVSNLKVWENILLPLWYHGDERAERREEEVLALLSRLGMEPARVAGFLAAMPASLPARERRILGVVRAMLPDAEVMVYAGLFDGLDAPTRTALLEETGRHHDRRAGRATLYVASDAGGLPPEPFAGVSLRQTPEGGVEPWR